VKTRSSDLRISVGGVLVIDKPTGISSYDVIRVVKKRLCPRKVGHTGTLDPLASGVLPIVINDATKIIPFLDERVKRYEGTLRLGMVMDSDDSTGTMVCEKPIDRSVVTEERIKRTFGRFVGWITQVPPMFSALKRHGRPLYELARRGIEVNRTARQVEVFDLEVVHIDLPLVDFVVSCSRGTYIRTLCKQIGDALGVGGHLTRLRRVSSGPFTLSESLTIPEFERLVESRAISRKIIPIREALGNMAEIQVDACLEGQIKRGRPVFQKDLEGVNVPRLERAQKVKILHQGKIVAIAKAQLADRELRGSVLKTPAFSLLRVFA
jgi:tRNA pseudouridine55 synthase